MIRSIKTSDAKQITEIYNYYVINTLVTFDIEPLSVSEFENRIENFKYDWLVYEENNKILGYAYAGKWRKKQAYNNTLECTVYLKNGVSGRGIGSTLYSNLIHCCKQKDIKILIGGLTLPNEASIRLHEKFGFEKVAHFKKVGFKFNQWCDVGFWQLEL